VARRRLWEKGGEGGKKGGPKGGKDVVIREGGRERIRSKRNIEGGKALKGGYSQTVKKLKGKAKVG